MRGRKAHDQLWMYASHTTEKTANMCSGWAAKSNALLFTILASHKVLCLTATQELVLWVLLEGWICFTPSRVFGTLILQESRCQAKGIGLSWDAARNHIGYACVFSWPLLTGECIRQGDRRPVLSSWFWQRSTGISWQITLSVCVSVSLLLQTRDNAFLGKKSQEAHHHNRVCACEVATESTTSLLQKKSSLLLIHPFPFC